MEESTQVYRSDEEDDYSRTILTGEEWAQMPHVVVFVKRDATTDEIPLMSSVYMTQQEVQNSLICAREWHFMKICPLELQTELFWAESRYFKIKSR